MGTNNVIFLEVIEWFDDSGRELAHRIPKKGSGEIKYGAQISIKSLENQRSLILSTPLRLKTEKGLLQALLIL
jgi:hypothetical protein